MLFVLKDKVAVITGAGSGIGRAIASTFGEQGATVCILDLQKQTAEETARQMAGQKASVWTCDVTDQSAMKKVMGDIVQANGHIDILVNSAGIAHVGKLETTEEKDFERLFNVNVKGTYNAMRCALPYMKEQRNGVILNLASVAATTGISDRFAYSMTKGAVVSMTLSVAKDYVQEGIRCNCVSPGRVHTPFVDGFLKANYPGREAEMFEKLSKTQPMGRMAKPVEIAHLALYLCSDEASFITGCDYPIDGGFLKLNS